MASNEIEVLDPAAAVDTHNKIAAGRALDRRRFLAALGMTGAVAGAGLLSGCTTTSKTPVVIPGSSEANILNFALNLEYLQATMYSYITTGGDLPSGLIGNSGTITGTFASLTGTGTTIPSQVVDMLDEITFDEIGHVTFLLNLLGNAAIHRPAINLAAFGAVTSTNGLQIIRVVKDIGVTAYVNALTGLTTSNATYAAQIFAVEGFHSGALRLLSIQNNTAALVAGDGRDVPPDDLGTPTAEAGGPTASGGFYPTYGAAAALGTTPGYAYSRTTSQVLALLYGSVTGSTVTPAGSGTASGGFFPSGVNGSINTV